MILFMFASCSKTTTNFFIHENLCLFMSSVIPYLPFLAPSLSLQCPGTLFNTLRELQTTVVRTAVLLSQLSQRQDIVAGYT